MIAADAQPANRFRPLTVAERLAGWIPVVILAYPLIAWPLAFGVPESERLLSDVPSQIYEPNLVNRLLYPLVFLIAFSAALVAPLVRLKPLANAPLIFLVVYFVWATASVSWALEPGIAFRRLVAQICVSGALVLSLLVVRDIERALMRLFGLLAAAAFLNVLVVATSAPGPLGHEGIYTQKNTLGSAAAMMMLFAIYVSVVRRGPMRLSAIAVLAMAAMLLVASQSKTSLGLVLLAPLLAAALLAIGRAFRLSAALQVAVGVLMLAIIYHVGEAAMLWDLPTLTGALFGDPTLTSRTDIWAFAMDMISRRPLSGFGFESFWGIGYEGPVHREAPGFVAQMPDAHNGYLDTLLQTGFIGLTIIIAMLLAALHGASRRIVPLRLSWLFLCIVIFTLGYNVSESSLFANLSFGWILFLIAVTAVTRLGYEAHGGSPRTTRLEERPENDAMLRSPPRR